MIHRRPLTRLQRGFWYLWHATRVDDLQDRQAIGIALAIAGDVDASTLRSAVERVVARYPELRARFRDDNGEPYTILADADAAFEWSVLDHRGAGDGVRDIATDEQLHRGFDLAAGPVLRVCLMQTAQHEWRLILVMHHIVGDRRSLYQIAFEVGEIYSRRSPETGIVEQADAGPIGVSRAPDPDDVAFWKTALEGSVPLQIPFGPATRSERAVVAGRVRRTVERPGLDQLDRVAAALGITPFTILLGAYFLALRRFCGQDDLRVGLASETNERRACPAAVGLCINTVVVRARLIRGQAVGAMLQNLRKTIVAAKRHDGTAFPDVVNALRPSRETGNTPLFEVMVNYVDARRFPKMEIAGLDVRIMEERAGLAQFDLSLDMTRDSDRLLLFFDHATDVLSAATVTSLADQFHGILDDILASSDVPIEELGVPAAPLVPAHSSSFMAVHERFVSCAAAHPDRVALRVEGESLTYRALSGWSSRIARALRLEGAAPDTRVGLCVARGLALAPAMLGILRAGAAYVPLDPSYPEARLRAMLEDARINLVVADPASAARLGPLLVERRLVLTDGDAVDDGPGVSVAAHPEQAAYVIYTSGSTGTPKGVVISHRAASLHFDDFMANYGIDADSVMLHSSTINFDVALHELLPALTVGGRVVVRGEDAWDLATLRQRLREEAVTFARLPTAYWQQWLHDLGSDGAGDFPALRQVTVGGEALAGDALARWRNGPLGHVPLDNLYGPTETTIAASRHRTEERDAAQVTVPIGRPFPSRHMTVADIDGHPTLPGALGELCIGGPTLARGYLHRPGLTAERFVPDPGQPGGRLYRSGDLCRCRPDGTVEFLGRIDNQIKLRGFRIELGEIEVAMRRCPGVREAVAVVSGEREHRRIVGYVTGSAHGDEVKRSLEHTLPDYMVPYAVMVLEALPLMPNGKLDRERLPSPAPVARKQAPPETEIEKRLVDIWSRLLKRDDVDRTADFFDLGGHSLLALQLIVQVEAEFGHRIDLPAFFRAPTIADIARWIADRSDQDYDFRQVVQLHPESSQPALFGLNSTGAFYHLAKLLGPKYPVVGLQLFDPARPPSQTPGSVEEVAAGYVDLIRRLQPNGPYHLFGWSIGGVLAFEVAQQLMARGAKVAFLGILDTWAPAYIRRLEIHRALLFLAVIRGRKVWHKLCHVPVILADLCRVGSRKGEFVTFLARHHTVARLFPSYRADIAVELARNPQTQYDTWLGDYLTRLIAAYVPRTLPIAVHLFRATLERRPPLSDPRLGWDAITTRPLQCTEIACDHHSICRPPGVNQTALAMAATIDALRCSERLQA